MSYAERTAFEYKRGTEVLVKQKFVKGTIHRFSWHSTIELMIILSGEIEVYANSASYLQRENDVLLLGSNCGHAFYPKSEDCVIFTTEISTSLLDELAMPIFKYGAISSNDYSEKNLLWITVRQQLMKINSYIRSNNGGESLSAKAIVATVIGLFVDLFQQCGAEMGEYLVMQEAHKRNEAINQTIEYINENYQEKVSLERVAEITGYSKTYMASLFKKQIGISIYEYLVRTRMQQGMTMLGDKEHNITGIALDCGFSDNRSFAVYTQKYCGRSPQEYRRLFAKEQKRIPLFVSQELIERKTKEYLSLHDESRFFEVLKKLKNLTESYQ